MEKIREQIKKVDPVLEEISGRLVEALSAKRLYLFGSRAKGNEKIDSDYDILVVVASTTEQSISDLIDVGHSSLAGINCSVDLIVMKESSFETEKKIFNTVAEIATHEGIELHVS